MARCVLAISSDSITTAISLSRKCLSRRRPILVRILVRILSLTFIYVWLRMARSMALEQTLGKGGARIRAENITWSMGAAWKKLLLDRILDIPLEEFPRTQVILDGELVDDYPAVILSHGIPQGLPTSAKDAVVITRDRGLIFTSCVKITVTPQEGRSSYMMTVPEIGEIGKVTYVADLIVYASLGCGPLDVFEAAIDMRKSTPQKPLPRRRRRR